jgi:hypothetical protein
MVLAWFESNSLGLMIMGCMVGQSLHFVKSNFTQYRRHASAAASDDERFLSQTLDVRHAANRSGD